MNPQTQALADQASAEAKDMVRRIVAALIKQRTEFGRDQAIANLALMLSWEPYSDPGTCRSLLLMALDMMADQAEVGRQQEG